MWWFVFKADARGRRTGTMVFESPDREEVLQVARERRPHGRLRVGRGDCNTTHEPRLRDTR